MVKSSRHQWTDGRTAKRTKNAKDRKRKGGSCCITVRRGWGDLFPAVFGRDGCGSVGCRDIWPIRIASGPDIVGTGLREIIPTSYGPDFNSARKAGIAAANHPAKPRLRHHLVPLSGGCFASSLSRSVRFAREAVMVRHLLLSRVLTLPETHLMFHSHPSQPTSKPFEFQFAR